MGKIKKFFGDNAWQIGLSSGGVLGGAIAGAKVGASIGIATGGMGMAATIPLGVAAGAILGLTGNRVGLELDKVKNKKKP